MDYEALKKLIKQTALSLASENLPGSSPRTASLTVAREHDDTLHQEFFTLLNAEVTPKAIYVMGCQECLGDKSGDVHRAVGTGDQQWN